MILVDTSIWIDHFRAGNEALSRLLKSARVVSHPFVIGELACGNLKNRKEILMLLGRLPAAQVADDNEVLEMVDKRKLMGMGIGWIDAHLLASALISGTPLWTADRKLLTAAAALTILY